MKPYYDEGGVTIYHGDCADILPSVSADAVLTDPPYGVEKASWDTRGFPTEWFALAATAAPVLGVTPGIINLTLCPDRVGRLVYRWTLSARLINGMTRGGIGFGNWIPCLVYASEEVKMYIPDGDAKEFAIGVDTKPDHPSPKPLNVTTWFLSRLPGASVIDPFMGSGTTLIAAKALGRKAIGIEVEERYCELAAKRLSQETLGLSA